MPYTDIVAQRVLDWTSRGQEEAFDIFLMRGCQEEKYFCAVVNPELMHHYEPPKDRGYVTEVA